MTLWTAKFIGNSICQLTLYINFTKLEISCL